VEQDQSLRDCYFTIDSHSDAESSVWHALFAYLLLTAGLQPVVTTAMVMPS